MTTYMSREQLHHALERKERQYAKLSRRVEYLRDRAAMADRLYKELDRASRTHRLCCRAGILEKYLTDPELLTNAQVEELIRMAFDHYDVQEAMSDMIQQAYEHPEAVVL